MTEPQRRRARWRFLGNHRGLAGHPQRTGHPVGTQPGHGGGNQHPPHQQYYLPGATLPDKLVATNDIGKAVHGADVIVMGIPSQNFRERIAGSEAAHTRLGTGDQPDQGAGTGHQYAHDTDHQRGATGTSGRRAHRPQPGARDHGRAGGGQRDRHGGRHHCAGAARRCSRAACSGCTPTPT